MERIFIETKTFLKEWASLGMDDEDLRQMQNYILTHPDLKNIIPGTDGIRKLRWEASDHGKRGGLRTIYIDFLSVDMIVLLYCYPKNKRDDLTEDEKKILNRTVQDLKKNLLKGRGENNGCKA